MAVQAFALLLLFGLLCGCRASFSETSAGSLSPSLQNSDPEPKLSKSAVKRFKKSLAVAINRATDFDASGCSFYVLLDMHHKEFPFEFNEYCLQVSQRLIDDMRVLPLLDKSRLPNLDSTTVDSLRKSAKALTFVMQQIRFANIKVEIGYSEHCLDFIIHWAPRNRFYDTLLPVEFEQLETEKKPVIFNALIDTFNPDECRFFPVIFTKNEMKDMSKIKSSVDFFFKSWSQKLVECAFKGKDIDRHIALLTASLLGLDSEWIHSYEEILLECIKRVRIPLLVNLKTPEIFDTYRIKHWPEQVSVLMYGRFFEPALISSIPQRDKLLYGPIFLHLSTANIRHYIEGENGLDDEHLKRVDEIRKMYNYCLDLLEEEKSLLFPEDPLEPSIAKWDERTLQRLANAIYFIVTNFSGVITINSNLKDYFKSIFTALLGIFGDNYIPNSCRIVPYTKLLFAVLQSQVHFIQGTTKLSHRSLCALDKIGKLLPFLRRNSDNLSMVRDLYPSIFDYLEFACRLGQVNDSPETFRIIHAIVMTLSPDESAKDFIYFIECLLDTEPVYFFSLFQYFKETNDLDMAPFVIYFLKAFMSNDTELFDKGLIKEMAKLLLSASPASRSSSHTRVINAILAVVSKQ